ncbi:oocyte zinc finger protein XlCOF7.1-like isoform X1 [Phyllobates terribilis]|uniref:oocyte zinc finger protein XlCOF7.1-like isoform X1 n=1 Tax=Phyllobates terribilis TaxID=111132 RepID=UPI003CCADE28
MYSLQDYCLTDPSTLDKDRCKMANSILNLTLEIIYLLTGEEYTVVKSSSEYVTSSNNDLELEERGKYQSPLMKLPPNCLIYDSNNAQKILELTDKIKELLTAEVSIRSQDVPFSMEEWEYAEDKKDLYKDVTMENHQTLISPDGSSRQNKRKRCPQPIYSKEGPEEKQIHQIKDQTDIKVEVVVIEEEKYVPCGQQCNEEKSLTDISPVDDCKKGSDGFLASPNSKEKFNEVEVNSGENPIREELPSMPHSRDLPSNFQQPSVAYSQTVKQIPTHTEGRPFGKREINFESKSKLFTHKSDERPYSCSECGKCFKQKGYLLEHQRIHTGENLFSCLECGKRFTQKLRMLEHQRVHTGEKPFSCLECGKFFSTKPNLFKHQRNHKREKPFSCQECEMCFTFKADLVQHERIHNEGNTLLCSECGKCFTTKWNLVQHQKVHRGVRPFLCSECGKCFTTKYNLVNHHRTHTGERPFLCPDCGKSFTQKVHLSEHQKHHKVQIPFS